MEPFGFFSGLLSGAILSIFAQFAAHPFIARRDKNNRRADIWNSECLLFKVPLIDTLIDLDDIEKPYSVSATLGRRFPSHQSAYVRFSLVVDCEARRGLDDAWKQYKGYHHQYKEEVIRPLGVDIPEAEQRKVVLEHINRLLSFAKET